MEILTANLKAPVRHATLNGRDYIVAPATLLISSVLNGSKGPLYYPEDEIAKSVDSWNAMPIVAWHPVVNGKHVSARDPKILDQYGLGFVFAANHDGKLHAELWFDKHSLQSADERFKTDLYTRVLNGKQIELSTGLLTDNEDKPGEINGITYQAIARNYRPDHVAILPDQKGACSIKDGCGVHNTAEITTQTTEPIMANKLTDTQKKELVTNLLGSCKCKAMPWSGKDEAALNALSEDTLIAYDEARKAVETLPAAETVTNTTSTVSTTAVTPPPEVKPKTLTEYLAAHGTAEEKAVWNSAVQIHQQAKDGLIDRITANMTATAKESAKAIYAPMSIDQLRVIADAIPQTETRPVVNYFGQVPAPVVMPVTQQPLGTPEYKFSRKSA